MTPTLNHDERKHVKTLRRRVDYLRTRVAEYRATHREPASRDLAEIAALRWVLTQVTGEPDDHDDDNAAAMGEAGRARLVPVVHGHRRDVQSVRDADVQRGRMADRLRRVQARWR